MEEPRAAGSEEKRTEVETDVCFRARAQSVDAAFSLLLGQILVPSKRISQHLATSARCRRSEQTPHGAMANHWPTTFVKVTEQFAPLAVLLPFKPRGKMRRGIQADSLGVEMEVERVAAYLCPAQFWLFQPIAKLCSKERDSQRKFKSLEFKNTCLRELKSQAYTPFGHVIQNMSGTPASSIGTRCAVETRMASERFCTATAVAALAHILWRVGAEGAG